MGAIGTIGCVAAAVLLTALAIEPAACEESFPFGNEMTLEALPQPGSKRIPNIEIGQNGEASLELWCKSANGQFSVAGNTVIFVVGQVQDRSCPPAKAQADDELLASLGEAATWKRQGDLLTLIGPRPLRFRMNGN